MSPRHAIATLALITAAALGATTAPAAAEPAETPLAATQGDSIWSAPADTVTALLGPLGDSIW
ncbi:hypothetical protein [Streptomyces lavendofoliae]|uniref:Secreted protein n=1 Tax=Streptomyces lavendofoliae TaxID=67314 RepID=A0A918M6U0_9ACTN|nr:hypothetical protein [Streptomyces lavendofoliae]GGU62337.1 hypothetical protein GCM10010274_58890 [Streptomyces lavendofoliae]